MSSAAIFVWCVKALTFSIYWDLNGGQIVLCSIKKMTSDLTINYGNLDFVQIYDKEKLAVGPDVIAGLLHVHCGKKLKVGR